MGRIFESCKIWSDVPILMAPEVEPEEYVCGNA